MNTSPDQHEILSEERRAELTLKVAIFIKWVSLLPILGMIGAWLLFPQYPHFLADAMIMSPIFFAALFYPVLYNKGHQRIGEWLLVAAIFFDVQFTPIVIPEIMLALAATQGVLYIIAYQILGRRDARWVSVIGVGLFAGMIVLTQATTFRLFSPLPSTPAFFVNLLFGVFCTAGTAYTVYLTTKEQDQLHYQQYEANRQITAAAEEVQKAKAHLENMVQIYQAYMEEVSQGNMLAHLPIEVQQAKSNEPLILLGKSLQQMTASLRNMISKIKETAGELKQAASEILAATTQQLNGASEQSTAISQTGATVEQVRAIAQQSMQHAQELSGLSQRSVAVARSGKQSVDSSVQGMQQISGISKVVGDQINSLSDRTKNISSIITTVSEIAQQSNMLALNASIEAARAGEAGRGFSVVATEVRSLAEDSQRATGQVKAIIHDIQKAAGTMIMVTEEGFKGLGEGISQVSQAGQAIEGLAQAVEDVAEASVQMEAGSKQQMSIVDQVSDAMGRINQSTLQSLSSTRQTESAARNLNLLAGELNELVACYHVG